MYKKIPFFLVPCLVLFGVMALRVVLDQPLEEVSLRVFDKFQNIRPRVYQDAPVRFIDIDDETLSKYGQWPWPRTQVGQLISKLSEAGVSTIVLDILFAEPDRTSPAQVLPLWSSKIPELEVLQNKAKELPDHDSLLAKTISETRVVTGFNLTNQENGAKPLIKSGFAFSGDNPLSFLPEFKGAVNNLEPLEKAAKGNGSFNFLADRDGALRRVPLVFRYKNQLVPSLAAEALRIAQDAKTVMIKSSGASGETGFGEHTGIVSVKIGNFEIPTDNEGRLWLYDTGFVPQRTVPAWKVLEGSADPKSLEGAIVFLGSSAAGLKDIRITPLNPTACGSEVHAQFLEQILTQQFLQRPDWAFGAELMFLLVLGLFLIFLLPWLGAALCAVFGTAGIAAAFYFSWHMFTSKHWLFDPLTPSAAALLVYFTVSLMNYLRTETERRQVRSAFSRYLSPALLEKISDPKQLKLGGEMKEMTILFSDIRDFTAVAENFSASELTHFMNRFLTPMTDVILQRNGTVDKYIGDCIMAFWNAPFDDKEHAKHACEAALAMQEGLKNWNKTLEREHEKSGKNFTPVVVGIGINTGLCCVGNMGSDQRFDYSVLGDDVNLASRLEGQSKHYGADIIVGQNTYEAVRDFAMVELDLMRVKGKNKPVRIYALLGDADTRKKQEFSALQKQHELMLNAYRSRNWNGASEILENLLIQGESFGLRNLYRLYQARIQACRKNPPPADWDGVFTAETK